MTNTIAEERKRNHGEASAMTCAQLGDFWWEQAMRHKKRKPVYEALCVRAANWYQEALANKEFSQPVMQLSAEKRIEEAMKYKGASEISRRRAETMLEMLEPITLKFAPGVEVVLLGCPKGTFVMGNDGHQGKPAWKKHNVTITRPFWLASMKVTHKLWNLYQEQTTGKGYALVNDDEKMGGWDRVHSTQPDKVDGFFAWLNQQSKLSKLKPDGYVFRLPTEAEWEYALVANVKDPEDLYFRAMNDQLPSYSPLAVQWDEERTKLPGDARSDKTFGTKVGTKLPNRWGFYDMIGNVADMMLDSVDSNLIYGNWLHQKQTALIYASNEKDPLRFFAGPTVGSVKRGGHWNSGWDAKFYDKGVARPRVNTIAIRIALGPDLLKERGLAK